MRLASLRDGLTRWQPDLRQSLNERKLSANIRFSRVVELLGSFTEVEVAVTHIHQYKPPFKMLVKYKYKPEKGILKISTLNMLMENNS